MPEGFFCCQCIVQTWRPLVEDDLTDETISFRHQVASIPLQQSCPAASSAGRAVTLILTGCGQGGRDYSAHLHHHLHVAGGCPRLTDVRIWPSRVLDVEPETIRAATQQMITLHPHKHHCRIRTRFRISKL